MKGRFMELSFVEKGIQYEIMSEKYKELQF